MSVPQESLRPPVHGALRGDGYQVAAARGHLEEIHQALDWPQPAQHHLLVNIPNDDLVLCPPAKLCRCKHTLGSCRLVQGSVQKSNTCRVCFMSVGTPWINHAQRTRIEKGASSRDELGRQSGPEKRMCWKEPIAFDAWGRPGLGKRRTHIPQMRRRASGGPKYPPGADSWLPLLPSGLNRSVETMLRCAAKLGSHGTRNDDDAVSLQETVRAIATASCQRRAT